MRQPKSSFTIKHCKKIFFITWINNIQEQELEKLANDNGTTKSVICKNAIIELLNGKHGNDIFKEKENQTSIIKQQSITDESQKKELVNIIVKEMLNHLGNNNCINSNCSMCLIKRKIISNAEHNQHNRDEKTLHEKLENNKNMFIMELQNKANEKQQECNNNYLIGRQAGMTAIQEFPDEKPHELLGYMIFKYGSSPTQDHINGIIKGMVETKQRQN